jgi:hypothetical protein
LASISSTAHFEWFGLKLLDPYFSSFSILLNNYCNWLRKTYFWLNPSSLYMYCPLPKRFGSIWVHLGVPASI